MKKTNTDHCKHHASLLNLKKSRSLLDKIIEMVEKDAYCIDIMQQNLAVIGLIKSVNQQLLEGHLNSCFRAVMESKNESKKQAMIKEILQVSKFSQK